VPTRTPCGTATAVRQRSRGLELAFPRATQCQHRAPFAPALRPAATQCRTIGRSVRRVPSYARARHGSRNVSPVEREIRTALWTSRSSQQGQYWPPFLDAAHRAHLGHSPREFMGKVGHADAAVAGEVEPCPRVRPTRRGTATAARRRTPERRAAPVTAGTHAGQTHRTTDRAQRSGRPANAPTPPTDSAAATAAADQPASAVPT